MHIIRFIKIAEKPRTMMRSLKNGIETTVPGAPAGFFAASIFEKITNNRKQILQIKVNLDKNEINFIKINWFEKFPAK
jgi:hypothetical protein